MKCKIVDLVQGSPEWQAHRDNHYNASELRAVRGFGGRIELLNYKKTGVAKEFDRYVEEIIFPKGHQFEAWARPLAEKNIGKELMPFTVSAGIAGLPLSYSSDGIAVDDPIVDPWNPDFRPECIWEHKQLNNELREALSQNEVPEAYHGQMEQGMLLTGAKKCLFSATDWDDEGNLLEEYHVFYYGSRAGAERVIADWKQFDEDLLTHEYQAPTVQVVGKAPELDLPAVSFEIQGKVLASNIDNIKGEAKKILDAINMKPENDQEFADSEKVVKFCNEIEKRMQTAEDAALAQTGDIDALINTFRSIRGQFRDTRLALDKTVKAEKQNRKAKLVSDAIDAFTNHILKLNERLGAPLMPAIDVGFPNAIKGLKSLDSMKENLSSALANAKVTANEIADTIEANQKFLSESGHSHLVPDFRAHCDKSPADFKGLVALRLQDEEARRLKEEQLQKENSNVVSMEKQQEPAPEEVAPVTTATVKGGGASPAAAVQEEEVIEEDPMEKMITIRARDIYTGIDEYLGKAELAPRTAVTVRKHLKAFVSTYF